MPLSRRNFLCSLGASASALACTASPTRAVGASGELPAPIPILLNRNENAYGTSSTIEMAMQSGLRFSNRFPEAACNAAVQQIASFHGVKPNQVVLGCGSTDIMRMCADAFLGPGATLITADPTFGFLQDYAAQLGSKVFRIPLNHRHEHDLDSMLARAGGSTNLIYICNPNNPTGTITPRNHLQEFLANLPQHTYVLMDEAYHHYAGVSQEYSSWVEYAARDPRLIVTRTFSKVYGLAGVRIGYAVASEPTIHRLMRYQLWAGINIAAALACSAALKDAAFVEHAVKRNSDDRQEFFNQAQGRMLKPLDSHTNFFFMDVGRPARGVIAHFKQHNILIGPEFPSMSTFIRVSFSLPKEMLAFWRVWDLLPRGKMSM